jgi:hypothetical protein
VSFLLAMGRQDNSAHRHYIRKVKWNGTHMSDDPIKDLNALLTSKNFSHQTAERVARVCLDAARLAYERLKQMKKTDLKAKEMSAIVVLAETLQSSPFRFVAEGVLAELFGQECDENTAVSYFIEKVLGPVTDKYGRKIEIDEDGLRSLYKDPDTGWHEQTSENYEEVRGKRLPWIRYTLQNSSAVYVVEELVGRSGVRRKFLYTATVTIKLQAGEKTSYYLVVVKEGKNDLLRLVTAYSMFERSGFLHAIAMGRLYTTQK